MKHFLLFIVFFHSLLYSQTESKVDSIAYYSRLANENIKNNNYKEAVSYIQKSIDYCKKTKKTEAEAIQTYSLGKIYFDLNLHNDAIELFNKSIVLFNSISKGNNNKTVAEAYYYLSLSCLLKKKYLIAETSILKVEEIQKKLNSKDKEIQIELQKGILSKIRGNTVFAAVLFNDIISKPEDIASTYSKAEAFYQIGTIEASNKRYNLALSYFNRALNLNKNTKNLNQQSDILMAISNVYDKLLDKSTAYTYLKKHLNLKESIVLANEEKLGTNDYESIKESQRKHKEILLEKENREKEKAD